MLVAKQISHDYSYNYDPEPVVQQKHRAKKASLVKGRLVLVGCVLLALITGLMFTATQSRITDRNSNIIQIKQEISDLQNSNERIKLEIARLKSLDRIEQIATTKLGMIQPGIDDIQYLELENKDQNAPNMPEVSGVQANKNNKATIEIKTGEKMNPALLAVSKMITNYFFPMKRTESEL